ncbi:MAG: carbamoyl-phosphate synthase large subunit, partial [Deltaproteobacteria bacterium]|nr:carbamoyl-phosphate synthase large subunit [Deltaproteobacteria bacterium]
QMLMLIEERAHLETLSPETITRADMRRAKRLGFSDGQMAYLWGVDEADVRARRATLGVVPTYKTVDTCSAEFAAETPYHYSTYEDENEVRPSDRKKVVILGSGPNRIGQGIEFDYCCVHAVMALREDDYETIMVNCNPETVSTDYDTADRLYFEPLTLEDVLEICEIEQPIGVIVQFGGQTPLKLAVPLEEAGIKLLGTSADAIDRAEDRKRFADLLDKLQLLAPRSGIAHNLEEVHKVVESIGYPVMIRPSYVLGGRAMEQVYDRVGLDDYLQRLIANAGELDPSKLSKSAGFPLLIDEFLNDAVELDIDVVADRTGAAVVGGVMEHIEEAGIHSGDSACSLPPYSVSNVMRVKVKEAAIAIARELGVIGLMNMQVALQGHEVYIIEVNPRASRTIPFVSKAIGVPLAKIAAKVMLGKTLEELGVKEIIPSHVSVKESVFPFIKFDNSDTILGPEMRSTGEVMGIDSTFAQAFGKAQIAAGNPLPDSGRVFISLKNSDKDSGREIAMGLSSLGFQLTATHGTAKFLRELGLAVSGINKVKEGRPHCVDAIVNGEFAMIINTTSDAEAIRDSHSLRRAALTSGISYFTTTRAANAAVEAIAARRDGLRVRPLQKYN